MDEDNFDWDDLPAHNPVSTDNAAQKTRQSSTQNDRASFGELQTPQQHKIKGRAAGATNLPSAKKRPPMPKKKLIPIAVDDLKNRIALLKSKPKPAEEEWYDGEARRDAIYQKYAVIRENLLRPDFSEEKYQEQGQILESAIAMLDERRSAKVVLKKALEIYKVLELPGIKNAAEDLTSLRNAMTELKNMSPDACAIVKKNEGVRSYVRKREGELHTFLDEQMIVVEGSAERRVIYIHKDTDTYLKSLAEFDQDLFDLKVECVLVKKAAEMIKLLTEVKNAVKIEQGETDHYQFWRVVELSDGLAREEVQMDQKSSRGSLSIASQASGNRVIDEKLIVAPVKLSSTQNTSDEDTSHEDGSAPDQEVAVSAGILVSLARFLTGTVRSLPPESFGNKIYFNMVIGMSKEP